MVDMAGLFIAVMEMIVAAVSIALVTMAVLTIIKPIMKF